MWGPYLLVFSAWASACAFVRDDPGGVVIIFFYPLWWCCFWTGTCGWMGRDGFGGMGNCFPDGVRGALGLGRGLKLRELELELELV